SNRYQLMFYKEYPKSRKNLYDIQRFFFSCSFAQALTFGRESITLKRGPDPARRKEIIIHGNFG
uniref:hypothetical protein n=1 Tax=unclassified Clostridium TaxID=2614128 RepID=UPI001A9C0C52